MPIEIPLGFTGEGAGWAGEADTIVDQCAWGVGAVGIEIGIGVGIVVSDVGGGVAGSNLPGTG